MLVSRRRTERPRDDCLEILGVQGALASGVELFLSSFQNRVWNVLHRYRPAVHLGYAALIELDDVVHLALDSIGARTNIIDVGG